MYQQFKVLSCDSHVMEPLKLYEERIDERFRPRLPQEVEVDGVKWRMTERHTPSRLRVPSLEGIDRERNDGGTFVGRDRAEAMDRDGVDMSVCYPNRGFGLLASNDGEFQLAIAQVYNEWVLETDLAEMPDRFILTAMLPPKDVVRARSELDRVAKTGRFKGLFMPA